MNAEDTNNEQFDDQGVRDAFAELADTTRSTVDASRGLAAIKGTPMWRSWLGVPALGFAVIGLLVLGTWFVINDRPNQTVPDDTIVASPDDTNPPATDPPLTTVPPSTVPATEVPVAVETIVPEVIEGSAVMLTATRGTVAVDGNFVFTIDGMSIVGAIDDGDGGVVASTVDDTGLAWLLHVTEGNLVVLEEPSRNAFYLLLDVALVDGSPAALYHVSDADSGISQIRSIALDGPAPGGEAVRDIDSSLRVTAGAYIADGIVISILDGTCSGLVGMTHDGADVAVPRGYHFGCTSSAPRVLGVGGSIDSNAVVVAINDGANTTIEIYEGETLMMATASPIDLADPVTIDLFEDGLSVWSPNQEILSIDPGGFAWINATSDANSARGPRGVVGSLGSFRLISRADDSVYEVSDVADGDVLNVRSGPGSGNPVVAELAPDATGITPSTMVITLPSLVEWWHVTTADGIAGWVHSGFIAKTGSGGGTVGTSFADHPCQVPDLNQGGGDGPLAASGTPVQASNADHILELESITSPDCNRVVITLGTAFAYPGGSGTYGGFPANTVPADVAPLHNGFFGDISIPIEFVHGDATSIASPTGFMVREPWDGTVRGGIMADINIGSAFMAVTYLENPARIVLDWRTVPIGNNINTGYPLLDTIVVREATINPDGISVTGFARPFEANVGISLTDAAGNPVTAVIDNGSGIETTSQFYATATDWGDAWGQFTVTISALAPGDYILSMSGDGGSDTPTSTDLAFTVP